MGENAYLTTSIFERLSLRGQVVVITGGARGIGLALAFAIAEAGGRVALVDASPNPHEHYALLKEKCARVEFYQITAAGICPDQRFLDRSPEGVKKCLEINSLGTYYSAQLAVEHMIRNPSKEGEGRSSKGSIIMIASIAAHQASKDQFTSDYCMSKGAVLSLTKQLGVELAEHHVRVNCLSPGYMRTNLTDVLLKARPALRTPFNEQPPMKRMGDCTDLMTAAVFLLSEASAYMTGAEMLITGGMHAGRIV
ncbi:hypothetical protein BDV38DRAFT_276880 [Aspergillus pseudotamarii]|uniref:Uncharacterized protein n=1 Tax=Aspergillus pseudotamarii TaxID=132259 RepID=A0A5N6TC09_ASPPS|nr:uncharacterized protein BDV38DRAFT_276880 [Aspergillus pseudotamarii]KAE8143810.1 hypothetical protein BDV38DRAFT_276880 [Aspergillus pseudotamarii]